MYMEINPTKPTRKNAMTAIVEISFVERPSSVAGVGRDVLPRAVPDADWAPPDCGDGPDLGGAP